MDFAGFPVLVTNITKNRDIFYCKEISIHKVSAFWHLKYRKHTFASLVLYLQLSASYVPFSQSYNRERKTSCDQSLRHYQKHWHLSNCSGTLFCNQFIKVHGKT